MKRGLHAGLAAALMLALAAADPAIAAERGRVRGRDRAADKAPDPPLEVRQVEALAFGRVTVRKEMSFVTIDPKMGAKRV